MSATSYKLNDGESVPWIAFGTGTAVFGQDAYAQVTAALNAGARHIDAAQQYRNEESVGRAIRDFLTSHPDISRSSLYVTTKFSDLGSGSVEDALRESLRKLQLSYIDLYLIHTPLITPAEKAKDLAGVWKQVEEVRAKGLAKSVGVSNFRVKDLEFILSGAKVIPAVNQIEYHPLIIPAVNELVDFHQKHGILTAAYGSLSPLFRSNKAGKLHEVLGKVQERLGGANEGQVLQKWVQQKQFLIVTTTSKEARAKEYLGVAGLGELTPNETVAVDQAAGGVHQRFFQKHMDS